MAAALSQKPRIRDQRRIETKRRIFESALALFRRDGVQEARLDEIAQAAGVSRPALYFHYPSRDDIVAEILSRSEERVGRAIEGLPPLSKVGALLEQVADLIAAEWADDARIFPDVGALALRRTSVSPDARLDHPVRRALAPRFAAAAERGELMSQIPPELLCDLFLLNQFAGALAWSGNPVVPLSMVLRGLAMLFLQGAKRGKK